MKKSSLIHMLLRCLMKVIHVASTNIATVGGAIKSTQKHRIFRYLKLYKQNTTFRAKAFRRSVQSLVLTVNSGFLVINNISWSETLPLYRPNWRSNFKKFMQINRNLYQVYRLFLFYYLLFYKSYRIQRLIYTIYQLS